MSFGLVNWIRFPFMERESYERALARSNLVPKEPRESQGGVDFGSLGNPLPSYGMFTHPSALSPAEAPSNPVREVVQIHLASEEDIHADMPPLEIAEEDEASPFVFIQERSPKSEGGIEEEPESSEDSPSLLYPSTHAPTFASSPPTTSSPLKGDGV